LNDHDKNDLVTLLLLSICLIGVFWSCSERKMERVGIAIPYPEPKPGSLAILFLPGIVV
jgi:hypothetical protein